MSETYFDSRIVEFCERLGGLDPGEKARFKRNAGRTLAESRNVLGLFFQVLPYGVPKSQEEIYFILATLFPLAEGGGKGNLGTSLYRARDPNRQENPGLDRRVEVLLDANREQLRFRLRQAIRYLESQRVTINWPQLLKDLLAWEHPKRYVQENWARSYFAPYQRPKSDASSSNA
jgi:CRISPR system Cascade subunit CasB